MGATQSTIKSGKFENGTLVLTTSDDKKTEVTGFMTNEALKDFVKPVFIKDKDGKETIDPYVVTSALDAKFATFQSTPNKDDVITKKDANETSVINTTLEQV